jgi:hypothetical protein
MSARQIADHECRVILDPDVCYIQDRRTGHLIGTDPVIVIHSVCESLTDFIFLPLRPLVLSAPIVTPTTRHRVPHDPKASPPKPGLVRLRTHLRSSAASLFCSSSPPNQKLELNLLYCSLYSEQSKPPASIFLQIHHFDFQLLNVNSDLASIKQLRNLVHALDLLTTNITILCAGL